jgi:hypothetical protein
VEFSDEGDGFRIAGVDAEAYAFRDLAEPIEGRVIRERTWRHRDLLARTKRARGLGSAASGEEAACLGCE